MSVPGAIFRLEGVSVDALTARGPVAPILRGIDLDIGAAEHIAIVGPSGAGKTTLLHTLAVAHEPASGTFRAFGCEPWKIASSERHSLRKRLFLAPQIPPLPPRQRVVTAVLAGLLPQWTLVHALSSLAYPKQMEIAAKALETFGIREKLFSRVERLSGGERQRVSLARMLVANAEAMLVDEPLAALDPAMSVLVLEALQHDARTRGAALICSLHHVELALASFPRLVGLKGGRIVFDLPRDAIDPSRIRDLYSQETESPTEWPGEDFRSVAAAPAINALCR